MINCELNMHGKSLLFTLFFILSYFQWHYNSWEASVHHTLWKTWLIFFLVWLSVYKQETNAIQSLHQEIYVIKESCNLIGLAIIQEQKFTHIWDLHSKIDNINFHWSTFPAKINDKIFQKKGKTLICGNNGAYFVVFSQKEFFLKKSSSVQLKWSPSI